MLVMLEPRLMPVTVKQFWNAPWPMLVTGRPFVMFGTVTNPPGPVYCTRVSAPLLVVKTNWARIAGGVAKSSKTKRAGHVLKTAQAVPGFAGVSLAELFEIT